MQHLTRRCLVPAAAVAILVLAGCSGGGDGPGTLAAGTPGAGSGGASTTGQAGGTLYVLNPGSLETWDPQRNSEAAVYGFAARTIWRTLTTAEPGTGKLVGDLATDTGTPSEDGKTWTFTVRDDVFWQDGQAVTCDDVRYGMSRSFATDQITGGSRYSVQYIDIPKDDKGKSKYAGPYTKTGQELFDKAVSCEGAELTIELSEPAFDFNQTVSTSGFVPFRADQDKGAKSNFTIFSNGPYMVEKDWKSGSGVTFVRNPHWKQESDPIRKALPDAIKFEEGLSEDSPIQRIISNSGEDQYAITQIPATPSQQAMILGNPKVVERTLMVDRTGVDFLQPNFKSKVMGDAKVREAFALATDRTAYAQALGGEELYQPTFSVLHHNLVGWSEDSPLGAPLAGDQAKAKSLLEAAGVTVPLPITVTYRKTATSDKALAALAEGWKQAGFDVKLAGISQNYYGTAASPASGEKYDVFWNTWGQSWPSAATIVPNLFDSRLNLSKSGSRLDYGYFDDAEINKQIDATVLIKDDDEREKEWGKISFDIAKQGGYVALTEQKAVLPTGSGVNIGVGGNGIRGQIDLAHVSVR